MFRVIRIKRVAVDLPAGHCVDFTDDSFQENVKQVCSYLWGKDINSYLVIKDGDEITLPSADLYEIEKFLMSNSYRLVYGIIQ
jgi:hypothetical protein